jgi:hypothetical protein
MVQAAVQASTAQLQAITGHAWVHGTMNQMVGGLRWSGLGCDGWVTGLDRWVTGLVPPGDMSCLTCRHGAACP